MLDGGGEVTSESGVVDGLVLSRVVENHISRDGIGIVAGVRYGEQE